MQRECDTRARSSNDPMPDCGTYVDDIVTNEQCEQLIRPVLKELKLTDRKNLVEGSAWYGLNLQTTWPATACWFAHEPKGDSKDQNTLETWFSETTAPEIPKRWKKVELWKSESNTSCVETFFTGLRFYELLFFFLTLVCLADGHVGGCLAKERGKK